MAAGDAVPFVLDRHFVDFFGDEEQRRIIRYICTRWPELNPVDVARWPWHHTAFYVEWLQQIVDETDQAEEDVAQQDRLSNSQAAIAALEALPGMGASFRQVS